MKPNTDELWCLNGGTEVVLRISVLHSLLCHSWCVNVHTLPTTEGFLSTNYGVTETDFTLRFTGFLLNSTLIDFTESPQTIIQILVFYVS